MTLPAWYSGSDVILGKNGTAGTEDRRIVAGATLSVDGIEYTLQIRDVEMSDQATYICQVIAHRLKNKFTIVGGPSIIIFNC